MSKDKRPGLRMGTTADHDFLNTVIAQLTLVMIETFPAGSVDGGTMATALLEVAGHAVAATFPEEEQGPVVEHLQHHLAVAVKRWGEVKNPVSFQNWRQTRAF